MWALGPEWGVRPRRGVSLPILLAPRIHHAQSLSLPQQIKRPFLLRSPDEALQLPLLVHWNLWDFQWTCTPFMLLSNEMIWEAPRQCHLILVFCPFNISSYVFNLEMPIQWSSAIQSWQKLAKCLEKGKWHCPDNVSNIFLPKNSLIRHILSLQQSYFLYWLLWLNDVQRDEGQAESEKQQHRASWKVLKDTTETVPV